MKRIHLKPEFATKGFYYLDHQPTGKVYTGVSDNMQQEILDIQYQLQQGTCKCKRLVRLHIAESSFVAKCFPVKGVREAKKLEKEFRQDKPTFLLIN